MYLIYTRFPYTRLEEKELEIIVQCLFVTRIPNFCSICLDFNQRILRRMLRYRACERNGSKKRMHTITTSIGLGSPSGKRCLPHTWHNKNRELQPEHGGTVCEVDTRWDGRTRVVCCCRWSLGWPLSSNGQHLEGLWDPAFVFLEIWVANLVSSTLSPSHCRISKLSDCRRCSGALCKSVHMMCLPFCELWCLVLSVYCMPLLYQEYLPWVANWIL